MFTLYYVSNHFEGVAAARPNRAGGPKPASGARPGQAPKGAQNARSTTAVHGVVKQQKGKKNVVIRAPGDVAASPPKQPKPNNQARVNGSNPNTKSKSPGQLANRVNVAPARNGSNPALAAKDVRPAQAATRTAKNHV